MLLVPWLPADLAFLGPTSLLPFGRWIGDAAGRRLGRCGGVLGGFRQLILDLAKLLLQLRDSRRQFLAIFASINN